MNRPNENIHLDSVFVGLKDRMFPSNSADVMLVSTGYGGDTLVVRHYENGLRKQIAHYPSPGGNTTAGCSLPKWNQLLARIDRGAVPFESQKRRMD